MSEKLFEPSDSRAPDIELSKAEEPQHTYLVCKKDGERTALVDIPEYMPTEYSGIEPGENFAEWSYTHYHAGGARTKVSHRLLLVSNRDGESVYHDTKRECVLGDREEHDWKTVESWSVP